MANPNPETDFSPAIRQAVRHLFQSEAAVSPYAILLESAGEAAPLNQWTLMGFYARTVVQLEDTTLSVNGEARPMASPTQLFQTLRELFAQVRFVKPPDASLPFHGGWMGYVGYEFYPWCDPGLWEHRPTKPSPFPQLLLCEFEDWVLIHCPSGTCHVLSENTKRTQAYQDRWQACLAAQPSEPTLPVSQPSTSYQDLTPSLTQEAFETAVTRLKAHIAAGEIYQANLSFQLQATRLLTPAQVYEQLCRRNPSPFSGVFQWPTGMILCNSPERLVQVDATGRIQSRPIAGTRGRGATPEADRQIGETLLNDEKEQAEHLMLVDLHRNDLGRLCQPGSVEVDELMVLERYSHVTHLVSNVVGQLQTGKDAFDVLQALFPGGTITGCPKIRCIQLLDQVEPVARGPYTGSLGYFDRATGALDLNILIRSLFLSTPAEPSPQAGRPVFGEPFVYNTAIHVGAGIVADSVEPHEYRECLRKAQAMLGVLCPDERPTSRQTG
jgi:para-aminobenzoate synthetase component 1